MGRKKEGTFVSMQLVAFPHQAGPTAPLWDGVGEILPSGTRETKVGGPTRDLAADTPKEQASGIQPGSLAPIAVLSK